jgi:hypothetical protein
MSEEKIDTRWLSRIDSDQKTTASQVGDLRKDLHSLELKVGKLEEAVQPPKTPGWVKVVSGIVIQFFVVFMIWLTWTVHSLDKSVGEINVRLTKYDIVTQLALPQVDFAASLGDLASTIAQARKREGCSSPKFRAD